MNTTEILSNKSRELLNDQLSTFDSNNSKAGTFISISALFIPITFSIFEKFATNLCWNLIFFIPIILNLIGIYFLIKSMYPKSVFHGINFNEFDDLVNKEPEEIQLFEIGINRDSFNDNAIILKEQNQNLKKGLTIIYSSAIVLSSVFLLNLTINYNIMSNNEQNTNTSSGNSGNQNTGSGNSDLGRQIPSTNPGQRSTIEKGGNPGGDILKK